MAVTDHSGTLTPNASTEVLPANSERTMLVFVNLGKPVIWVNITGAAASSGPGSIPVAPGQTLRFDGSATPTGAINAFAPVTNFGYPLASVAYTLLEA